MKSCVVTENFACDPMKVWLYLTKPTLNNWCKDVSAYEESSDGMTATEKHTDGSETQITFTRKEKPRCLSCSFQRRMYTGCERAGTFCQARQAAGGTLRYAAQDPRRVSGGKLRALPIPRLSAP